MSEPQSKEFGEDDRIVAIQADLKEAAEVLFGHYLFDGLEPEMAMQEVLGRFERLFYTASGPEFDEDGFLPPLQICSEAEVIRWFGFSDRRQQLLDRIRKWIDLAKAVEARRLFLDGSFVTQKNVPGDVDAVVLLPEDFREQLRYGNPAAVELHRMFLCREPEEIFAAEDEEDWWAWFAFFSRTRKENGRYKGLIEVTL